MDTTIQIRADKKLRQEIETLAKADRRTVSDYLRLVLENHVEQLKIDSQTEQPQ